MNKLSRVEIFESLGQLVHNKSDVYVLQNTLANNIVEVSLHVLEDQIDVFVILGSDNCVQLDNVLMV